jgi:hypothetical protein
MHPLLSHAGLVCSLFSLKVASSTYTRRLLSFVRQQIEVKDNISNQDDQQSRTFIVKSSTTGGCLTRCAKNRVSHKHYGL